MDNEQQYAAMIAGVRSGSYGPFSRLVNRVHQLVENGGLPYPAALHYVANNTTPRPDVAQLALAYESRHETLDRERYAAMISGALAGDYVPTCRRSDVESRTIGLMFEALGFEVYWGD